MDFKPQKYTSITHSPRSYPRFNPHITLTTFPSLPSKSLAQLLPKDIKPPFVTFESVRIGTNYLGAVSVFISKSHELIELRNIVMEHLEDEHKIDVKSHSFPNMSLFYLDETVSGERRHLTDILQATGRVIETEDGSGVALNCTLDGASSKFSYMTGFMASEIWLVDYSGAVSDWKVLEKHKIPEQGRLAPSIHSIPANESVARRLSSALAKSSRLLEGGGGTSSSHNTNPVSKAAKTSRRGDGTSHISNTQGHGRSVHYTNAVLSKAAGTSRPE